VGEKGRNFKINKEKRPHKKKKIERSEAS